MGILGYRGVGVILPILGYRACGSNYNWNGEITTGRVKLQLGCLQLGSPGGAPSNKIVFGAFTFRSAGDVTHIAFRRGSQGKPGCDLSDLRSLVETRWNYKVHARVSSNC